ncbi:MAG: pilus assembly protein PilM [Deltaproteobacteria bacterium]|nr:pilus assembly protein PilM [Deltaproteobacteria bacterium]
MMFSFRKNKTSLGLDIGSKMTKVVQLGFNGSGSPSLETCDLLETGTLDEGFSGNIKSYFKEKKFSGALVATSIEDASMKIRKMEFPKMPEADLLEAIKWSLRDLVEGDIEKFIVNYSTIEETESNEAVNMSILAYAINRQAMDDHHALISGLGLVPFFIEPAAVTLASTLERCYSDDVTYIAGVDLGYKNTIFYVVGKGVFVFSRPLIGINMEEQIKDPDSFNQKLAIEIQKSIDTFKVNFKMEEISKIYLSGGGSQVSGLDDYLTQNMGVKTSLLDPLYTLSDTDRFADVKRGLFAQAVGLAYLQP